MKKIKAIETAYNGYKFRSRLEARWAVAFDHLGLKWDYEIEGFDLGFLGGYLPDFWLPESKWFVEIKSTDDDPTLEKARYLDDHPPDYAMGCLILTSDNLNPDEVKSQMINEEMICSLRDSKSYEDGRVSEEYIQSKLIDIRTHFKNSPYLTINMLYDGELTYSKLYDALCVARSARFERGENMNKYY